MLRSDFHYALPEELIAQRPTEQRSASRLLVVEPTGACVDRVFTDFPALLTDKDLLVFNDTRVVPARVHGVKDSGGKVEILLERAIDESTALVQLRASKGLKTGAYVNLPGGVRARMEGRHADLFSMRFSCDVLEYFEANGAMPLPPYVQRPPDAADRERYQTIFARLPGAVAAPTAGLHFDAAIFEALAARRVAHAYVTLHVGAGTFQPMRAEKVDDHVMHEEYVRVPEATCRAIDATRAAGGRVVAVGTTVVRSLETAAVAAAAGPASAREECAAGGVVAAERGQIKPFAGMTRIFITPGYQFRIVDALLTNLHLPESTLLMLCAALVGREPLLAAYAHAVAARYRFFSYGDAMFLSPALAGAHR